MSERKKWALKEFDEARSRGTYKSLAQKLAQHLNNLAQDKNTRIRWVWELIQNAKDASNQLRKCKIRIEIHENKFIFAHNGNPFRIQDLYSIVAQYSSKSEQNTTNSQTTGKYGTGFITTYILSRKVRIKGLVEKQEESTLKEEEQQQKPLIINNSECQMFEIFLDRQYKDRDKQFYYKLIKTQRDLIEQLQKNDPQPKWQLRQDEFNTQFAYQQLDEEAFKMIEESMNYLKQLFPYALLFNPNILQIKMIDKRKDKKLRNFGIKRIQQTKINNLSIFNAQILQEGKESSFSLAYLQDKDTYSVVAIPLKKNEKTITVLELNHKMPKMFKEFPLIGCRDTGFNFVFTSQLFYPSQTRSDLLLKEIQSRNSKKSCSNWVSLEKIFQKAKLLYKTLAQIATQGIQNLLILTIQNQFSSDQFKDKNFKTIYNSFLQQISNIKCIDFKNKRRGLIKEILCPFGKSFNTTIEQDQYSKKMNLVFSLLLGQGNVLNDDQYQRFYPKLIKHRKTWQGLIQFKQLKDCLKILHTLTFKGLILKAGNTENALNVLENIYQFLQQHNPEFVTQEKFTLLRNEQQINYVLTNKYQLKDLKHYSCNLMKKMNVPDAYCEVANSLGIDINQNLIFDRFTKFFEKTPQFTIKTILGRFHNFFFNIQNNGEKYLPKLIQLGRFLVTFNISSKIFDVASIVKSLSDMCTPYKLYDSQSKLQMSKQMANDLRMQLQYGTLSYLNDQISEKMSLTKMINILTIKDDDKNQAIKWLDKVYEIQKTLIPFRSKIFEKIRKQQQQKFSHLVDVLDPNMIVWYGLAVNQHFYFIKRLNIFNNTPSEKYPQYPDQYDLEFYAKMRQICNKKKQKYGLGLGSFLPVFSETILHPLIRHKSALKATFKDKFLFTLELYGQLHGENKIFFINYLHNCEKKAKEDPKLKFKTEMFKQIIKDMYYDYPKEIKCLERSEDQQFMYHLYNHVEDIAYAKQIHEIVGLRQGLQKLKSEITNGNKEKGKQSSDDSLSK